MTNKQPFLFINRLIITKNGSSVYDQVFHDGINIIRGSNGSGKSTISDFIYFCLGADFNLWKIEASECDFVFLELNINNEIFTVKRFVTKDLKQPMLIYWGPIDDTLKNNELKWEVYPYSRSEKKLSYSQILFKRLNIPEIINDNDDKITIHQLLRLIYIDQLSPTDALIKPDSFDTPIMRDAISEAMLGIYDNSSYSDEYKLKSNVKQLEILNADYKNLAYLLKEYGTEIDRHITEKYIKDLADQLTKLNNSISVIDKEDEKKINSELTKEYKELRDLIRNNDDNTYKINTQIESINFDINDSDLFIQNLEKRLKAINESIVIRETLGILPLTYCPHCLTELEKPENEDACILCKKVIKENNLLTSPLKMKNELEFQIKESKYLLDQKYKEFQQLKHKNKEFLLEKKLLYIHYEEFNNKIILGRDKLKDELLIKKGNVESQIEFANKQLLIIDKLEELINNIGSLRAEIEKLKKKIEISKAEMLKKKNKAFEIIKAYSLLLLRNDMPTEELFATGNEIEIDFRKNTYSLDGRNQFSASSMVFLKNSIRFSIFFASLDLDYFRFPRFILCDNTEDKGMVQDRSQIFQNLIVSLSEKSETKHQIILTTSMIAPKLDNIKYCIGDKYTKENKTLKLK